jgi:hypothetical protein
MMNVYLLNEDGETFCVRAETMARAVAICEECYLQDRKEDEGAKYDDAVERGYYHEMILQSCTLIGELKN